MDIVKAKEVITARTEHAKTFSIGGGKYRSDISLHKRLLNGNIYHVEKNRFKGVVGGIPNVLDNVGVLVPFDNELKIVTTHPIVKYVLKQGGFFVGFHNKINNKYLSVIKLHSGESLIKTIVNDVPCTPIVKNKHTLQWLYPNGAWIEEYATERKIKEVMLQKAGQQIKFKYALSGFTVEKVDNKINVLKGNKIAFSIQRPYYMTSEGDFVSWVPVAWEKIGDDWVVTYPAPAEDSYIDPVIVFGEGAGQTGEDHKDTYVDSANVALANGGGSTMACRLNRHITLLRFSLIGHIPINAIINNANLRVVIGSLSAAQKTISINPMITNWGVDLINEGTTQNPAVGGQATWRRAFDFNGAGGDIVWGGGGNISAVDWGVAINTFIILNGAAIGTEYIVNITAGVANDILNDATNLGYSFTSNVNSGQNFDSQESVTIGERPYLTVDYSLLLPIMRRRRSLIQSL